jgi:para-aminobenzoate synthetase component 2
MRTIIIDNYDSFTYNLHHYLEAVLNESVLVKRNDEVSLEEVSTFDNILLSPGPGLPEKAGITMDVLRHFSNSKRILGVCLGHQAIAQVFGGRVVRAPQLMHGKTSAVRHGGQGVFAGLPNPLTATRYHSLIAERESLPACLEVTAWLEADGMVMGLRHRSYPLLQGVQFHPESVLTEAGHQLLANFLSSASA